ncbi:MAG: hypothetical protein ACYTEP_09135 [Planctomycetota bacterium]|jgi:hypothetical protein
MNRILPILSAIAVAGSLSAQTTVLSEDFSSGVPPTGWTHVNNNAGIGVGWIASADGRAWHQDEAGVGTTDFTLVSPAMDLTALANVYLHFEGETNWANYLANHPTSLGDGISNMEISTDGGLTWTVVWTDTSLASGDEYQPDVDLSAWAGMSNVQLGIHFYGTFAQEWWVDNVLVDDSPVGPPPSGDAWAVNLPTTFASVPFADDFDASAGSVPTYMALTNVDGLSGAVDVEAWCNVGQLAACLVPNSGAFNLEMGLDPNSVNYHEVRNAMVLGINGGGSATLNLDFAAVNFGEETHDADGVWVSSDGANWFAVTGDWASVVSSGGLWASIADIDLTTTPVDTSGDFYLMFQQYDNFPYNDLDGIGIDDIAIDAGGPSGPTLSVSGTCPGVMTISGSGLTASGPVAVVYGPSGSFAIPGGSCAGLVLDISAPTLAAVVAADASGDVSVAPNIPGALCGSTLQMVDLTACAATNSVIL